MLVVSVTYVNVLAFVGGIGLAAMQSQSLPSDGGTMPASKMEHVVSAVAAPSETVDELALGTPDPAAQLFSISATDQTKETAHNRIN